MTKDMTEGRPLQLILRFSIPLILGNLFQQFYNMADTMIVGKVLGLNALTAVGATSSVNFLIVGFIIGVCNGFAIPVAQAFGGRDYSSMRKYVVHIVYVGAALAILMTILTTLFCGKILTWMKTPDQIIGESYAYYWVICLGIPFTFLYNSVSGIVRAMGDSRTPFYFLVMSTILNILLDLFFIIVLHMGVAGAAWATILAQAAAGITSLLYMRKKYRLLRASREEQKIQTFYIRVLLGNGIPMGLQSSITAIGSIMLQSAVNMLELVYVSAFAAAMKVKQLLLCPYEAIAASCATFAGQNLGAKKVDRISKGLRAGIFIAMIYTILISIVLVADGSIFALLFVDKGETAVLESVRKLFFAQGCFFWLLPILNCTRMTIQGLGHSGVAVLAGCSELVARGIMAVYAIPVFGYTAVCFTDQVAWIAATAVCVVVYEKVKKKEEMR